MTEEIEIPEELKLTFKRIIKKAPCELREEIELQKTTLVYLKLGGEKLARQRIELTKKQFREGYLLLDRLMSEDAENESSEETPPEEP
jgi:hypothetical protein